MTDTQTMPPQYPPSEVEKLGYLKSSPPELRLLQILAPGLSLVSGTKE